MEGAAVAAKRFPTREAFAQAYREDPAELYNELRDLNQALEDQIDVLQESERENEVKLNTARIQTDNALRHATEQDQRVTEAASLIARLRQERNEARAIAQAPAAPPNLSATPPPPTNSHRSERMPDPEKFDGSRAKLPGFILQLRSKLTVNRDRFANETTMILYTINRLEGAALEQVRHTVLPSGLTTWTSAEQLITALETAFGDPDPTGTARRELHQLRQGKRDFSAYLADFQRIMGQLNFDENSKMDALEHGMSEELKEAMVFAPAVPTNLNDTILTLTRMDNRIRARKAEKRGNTRDTMGQFSAPSAFSPVSSFTPGGLAPMDLSFGRTSNLPRPPQDQRYTIVNGRRKLSEEEKQWRRSTGKCMFCAAPDHSYANCPSAPKKPAMRGASTNLSNTPAPPASSARQLPPPPLPPQFFAIDAPGASDEALN